MGLLSKLNIRYIWDMTLVGNISFVLGLMTGVVIASSSISLKVTPRQVFEPATIRTTITVERNPENQAVCLDWDSIDGMAGAHCWAVDGANAPRVYTFDVKGLTAGDYEFTAAVFQRPKWIRTPGQVVNVIGTR